MNSIVFFTRASICYGWPIDIKRPFHSLSMTSPPFSQSAEFFLSFLRAKYEKLFSEHRNFKGFFSPSLPFRWQHNFQSMLCQRYTHYYRSALQVSQYGSLDDFKKGFMALYPLNGRLTEGRGREKLE